MFEKEAENYQQEVITKKDFPHSISVDWQRGAEFGYNKANEWHYVKDGDLPKKEGRYYCAIKTTIITGGYKYDVEIKNRGRNVHSKKWFWADYSDPNWCEWELMKVYAWKEIVPPIDKEIEK